jgi:hypothetical protein
MFIFHLPVNKISIYKEDASCSVQYSVHIEEKVEDYGLVVIPATQK